MPIDSQSGFALFNAVAAAGKTIYDLAQGASKVEEKQRLMEVYDQLMTLKHTAAEMEDENRILKEKLRFKSDDFSFESPFHYEKKDNLRKQPLCPKCFSKQIIGYMAAPYDNGHAVYRRCLVCDAATQVGPTRHGSSWDGGSGGPDDWMGH